MRNYYSNNPRINFRLFSFLLLVFFAISGQAQIVVMPATGNDTTNLCSGVIQDPGGSSNYSSYTSSTLLIDPPGNEAVNITFNSFILDSYSDRVTLYDGDLNTGIFLGNFYGSTLPNSGASFTANSGRLTVYFYSNCCTQAAGFVATFSTGSNTAPTASFTPSTTAPAFNTGVQFVNTTSAGGTYLWDFGDGNTSMEENPTHRFVNTGQNLVKLISTNCTGFDTSSVTTITVGAAPQGAFSTDTVSLSLACGTSGSTTFNVSNSASGNLNYDLALLSNSNYQTFGESFENGLGSFVNNYVNNNLSFPNTSSAEGNQHLTLQSGDFYNPVEASFSPQQPDNISYYVRSDSYANYHGQFDIFSNENSFQQRLFYSVYRYNGLYLYYYNKSLNYTTYYNFPQNDNIWYNIELRNIDWANSSYDIYVDNVLLVAGAGFYIQGLTRVEKLSLKNSYYATTSLDAVYLDGLNPNNIFTYNPKTGNLGNNSNNSIIVNANTIGLNAGNYYFDFLISSNDTALDGKLLPLKLEVTGDAQLFAGASCNNLGEIYTNITYYDSLLLTNLGCDTLNFSSITTSSSNITANVSSLNLAPNDTALYFYDFSSAVGGTVTDTLYFKGPDTNFAFCFTGVISVPPVISLDSTSYTVNHTGCTDSALVKLVLNNSGADTLNWSVASSALTNYTDDFESGTINSNLWGSSTLVYVGNSCGTISGQNTLIFDGYGFRSIVSKPLNLTGGATIKYDVLFRGSCETPDNGEGLNLDYSIDGGQNWVNFSYHYLSSTLVQNLVVTVPVAAEKPNTLIRLSQASNSGSGYDNWIVDNFEVAGAVGASSNVYFVPDSGITTSSGFDTIYTYIHINNLITGTYDIQAVFTSNDPVTPLLTSPITLNLTGVPNLVVPTACIVLDSVFAGTTVQDSVMIFNDGCGSVTFNSFTTSTTDLIVSNAPTLLEPGDTTYISYTFSPAVGPASFNDTIVISSNDVLKSLCVDGYVKGAPVFEMDTTAINITINACNDSVNVQRYIYNNGLSGLNYEIKGDSDSLMSLQTILDTFKTAYTNITAYNTNQYNFTDGIYNRYIYDGGNDMYNYGNYLGTDLTNYVYYSNDVVNSTGYEFGTNGSYFTYKGNGIFLLAADMDNVNEFKIYGSLGANGGGTADVSTITKTVGGVSYTGYIKRVYNAGDPSVNHLIITETNSAISRTFNTSTYYDEHNITGLSGNERLYYMLFAGNSGQYFGNSVFQNMMDEFLSIIVPSALPDFVSVSPDSGNVAMNDSVLLDFWVSAKGLASGTYDGTIKVNNNDPLVNQVSFPISLTVNGSPELDVLQTSCLTFTNIQQGATEIDTFMVGNTGCDTLKITSASSSLSEFAALGLPLSIAPGDTVLVEVGFTPITVATFADTLLFATNDTSFSICVNGTSVGAPFLTLPQDTLEFTLNKCKIIGNTNFRVNNTGLGIMNYDMNFGGYSAFSKKTYNTTSAITTHNFGGIPALSYADTIEIKVVVNGDYDDYYERAELYIDGSYWSTVYDNNLSYTADTITFLIYNNYNIPNWTNDNQIDIELRNSSSVDGATGSYHEVLLSTKSNVNWVSIVGSTTGSISTSSFVSKNVLFNATLLPVGVYNTVLNITSNSPSNPNTQVPVIFNVVSEAEMNITDTCLIYPLTLLGDTTTKTFSIYNDGCVALNLTSVSSANQSFKIIGNTGTQTLQVGDSAHFTVNFIPTVVGNFNSTITIVGSGKVSSVCLNASSGAVPVSDFSVSPENACIGEFGFVDRSLFNPTTYYWQFGDGNYSNLSNPTHNYAKPGTYKVLLRVNNAYGFDTISQIVTANPLYASFGASNDFVVEQDSAVTFTDSSITGNTWFWTFGDGSSSTVQNPTHTYLTKGNYTVTLLVTDSRGCSETVSKNMFVAYSIGLTENTIKPELHIYPNPASDYFTLKSNLDVNMLRIFDATGKLVVERVLNSTVDQEHFVGTSFFPSGMYFVKVYDVEGGMLGVQQLAINR